MSVLLTAAPVTRTSTSPGLGAGTGQSSRTSRASRPPCPVRTAAVIVESMQPAYPGAATSVTQVVTSGPAEVGQLGLPARDDGVDVVAGIHSQAYAVGAGEVVDPPPGLGRGAGVEPLEVVRVQALQRDQQRDADPYGVDGRRVGDEHVDATAVLALVGRERRVEVRLAE